MGRTRGVNTKHLKAALALAHHGSFTKAAQELYVAQSTLSRHVAALERELGAVLFVRGIDAVTPTAAGAAFLPEAEQVLLATERARSAVHLTSCVA